MNDVVIVGAKRTAIGSMLGQFTGVPTPTLGATAISAALADAGWAFAHGMGNGWRSGRSALGPRNLRLRENAASGAGQALRNTVADLQPPSPLRARFLADSPP